MRKILVLFSALLIIGVLAACDSTTEDKEVNSVESSSNNTVENNDEEVEAEETNANNGEESTEEEIGEVIADDDYIKATLEKVETVKDDIFGDSHVIKMSLENKTNDKIVVQSRDVSIDGTMVDDMVMFSEEIAGEKNANGKMEIMAFEEDLPEMNDNIEFKLIVLDDETYDTLAEHDVKVDF